MRKTMLVIAVLLAVGLLVTLLANMAKRDQEPVELLEKNRDVAIQPELGGDQGKPDGTGAVPIRRVEEIIEREVEPMTDISQLDPYLQTLEERATENRKVSLFEINPGIEAIRKFRHELGPEAVSKKIAEFHGRMEELSLEFQGAINTPPANAAALIEKIGSAKSDEDRKKLLRQFLESNQALDPDQQNAALEQFDKLMKKDSEGKEAVQ